MIRFQFDIDGKILQDFNIKATETVIYNTTSLSSEAQTVFDGYENVLMTPEDDGRVLGSKFADAVYNESNTLWYDSIGGVVPTDSSSGYGITGLITLTDDFDYPYSGIQNAKVNTSATSVMLGDDFDD